MSIPYIINYLLLITWLLIPFKQAKTSFFLYFLLYAISSAFVLIDQTLQIVHLAYFYLGVGFFLIISLYNFKKIPHYIFFLTGVLIISIILPFILSIEIITVCLVIQHIAIFFIILKRTVLYINEYEKLNLFQFILLLYEITLITRFIVVIGNIKTGIIFFYLTAAFGIFIGIFFLFYNELNSPKIPLADKSILQ